MAAEQNGAVPELERRLKMIEPLALRRTRSPVRPCSTRSSPFRTSPTQATAMPDRAAVRARSRRDSAGTVRYCAERCVRKRAAGAGSGARNAAPTQLCSETGSGSTTRISDNPAHVGQYRGLRNSSRIASRARALDVARRNDGSRVSAWSRSDFDSVDANKYNPTNGRVGARMRAKNSPRCAAVTSAAPIDWYDRRGASQVDRAAI